MRQGVAQPERLLTVAGDRFADPLVDPPQQLGLAPARATRWRGSNAEVEVVEVGPARRPRRTGASSSWPSPASPRHGDDVHVVRRAASRPSGPRRRPGPWCASPTRRGRRPSRAAAATAPAAWSGANFSRSCQAEGTELPRSRAVMTTWHSIPSRSASAPTHLLGRGAGEQLVAEDGRGAPASAGSGRPAAATRCAARSGSDVQARVLAHHHRGVDAVEVPLAHDQHPGVGEDGPVVLQHPLEVGGARTSVPRRAGRRAASCVRPLVLLEAGPGPLDDHSPPGRWASRGAAPAARKPSRCDDPATRPGRPGPRRRGGSTGCSRPPACSRAPLVARRAARGDWPSR